MEPDALDADGLARAYDAYKQELERQEALAAKGEAGTVVLERLRSLELLFATVTGRDVRELSMFVRDSEALRGTAALASLNAENVRFGDLTGTLSGTEFVEAAKTYLGGDHVAGLAIGQLALAAFQWLRLGTLFQFSGKKPLPSSFLYGPLATKRRRVAPRARTVDDTTSGTKTTAQAVSTEELQGDLEQTTSHMVRMVFSVIAEHGAPIGFYTLFINPASFAQLVENLFYVSFLVRDGKIKVYVEDGKPMVAVADDEETEAQAVHRIATFDYASWTRLKAEHAITESFIPHRDVEEDTIELEPESDEEVKSESAEPPAKRRKVA